MREIAPFLVFPRACVSLRSAEKKGVPLPFGIGQSVWANDLATDFQGASSGLALRLSIEKSTAFASVADSPISLHKNDLRDLR